MSAFFSNGENITSGADLAENVIYNKEDGTRSTVKTEIDEINNNLSDLIQRLTNIGLMGERL